jgi:hypothetical protein
MYFGREIENDKACSAPRAPENDELYPFPDLFGEFGCQ